MVIAGYLLAAGKPLYALALVGLIIPQIVFQVKHMFHKFADCLSVAQSALIPTFSLIFAPFIFVQPFRLTINRIILMRKKKYKD